MALREDDHARQVDHGGRAGPLLFPARGKDTVASGFSKWKRALDDLARISEWRIHDLRRTAATRMAELKVPPHVIERILNHSTGALGGVAAVYNRHGYLPEMRSALSVWQEYLASLVLGDQPKIEHR